MNTQATTMNASDVSDARAPRKRFPLMVGILALVLLIICGGYWVARWKTAKHSPFDPADSTVSILVPPADDLPRKRRPTAAEAASSPAPSLTAIPPISASSSPTAPSDAPDALTELRRDVDNAMAKQLEINKALDARMTELGTAIDGLRTAFEARAAAAAAAPARAASRAEAARRMAKAKAAATAASQVAVATDTSLLAVDLWAGRPSVAITRAGASGSEVRFYNEGESQGRVTLQSADVGAQRATFSTSAGEMTLAPRER